MRVKSNKSQGGQTGHQGGKLKMITTPDRIEIHDVTHCDCCCNKLPISSQSYTSRQVFDIPVIQIQVTEHRRLNKACLHCGKVNTGVFPKAITAQTQYGNTLKSLCVYLQNYQMLPYPRCKEFIADLTGPQTHVQQDLGHGRIETRKCSVINSFEFIENQNKWVELKGIVKIESTREFKNSNKSSETATRYYITSLEVNAETLQKMIRLH